MIENVQYAEHEGVKCKPKYTKADLRKLDMLRHKVRKALSSINKKAKPYAGDTSIGSSLSKTVDGLADLWLSLLEKSIEIEEALNDK